MRQSSAPPTAAPAPTVRLDACDPVFRDHPHAVLDDLRARRPVHRDQAFDRVVLTRADDVAAVLADRTMSSDPLKGRPRSYGRGGFTEADRPNMSMLFLDDPDHARLRRLVVQAFSARAVEAQRPRVEAIATTLLDRVDLARPFDLMAEYAVPLPIFVIAAVLGIEDARVERFKEWSDAVSIVFAPERSEAQTRDLKAADEGLNACFREAIAARRGEPRDDLVGALVAAESEGSKLSDAEILNTCRLLLIAGNLTTTDLIGNGVVALLRHPEQLARVRAEPESWPAAIEEVLRYDAPVSAVNRQTVAAREIGGCPVDAGQTVTAMLLAANHDSALHADPHAFDVGRQHQRHHSFGAGAHFCLGASLARLEAQVALSALFDRCSRLRLAPGREPRRKGVPAFNGYEAVWLAAA